jgi:hypothetical protein
MNLQKISVATIIILSMVLPLSLVQAGGDDNPMTVTSVPREMSYQGILMDSGGDPVTDSVYSVTFRIYNVASGGTSMWDETKPCTTSAGVFNASLSNVDLSFSEDYWLELEIDSEILDPRQKMGMVGYAAVSDTADFAMMAKTDCWKKATTIISLFATTDSVGIGTDTPTEKLEVDGKLKVTEKATIGPGHTNTGTNAFVAGENNTASGEQSTVSGGLDNTASGNHATVSGGYDNIASDTNSTVAGGIGNEATRYGATVSGGRWNRAHGIFSVVSGGGGYNSPDSNVARGDWSVVAGGQGNVAETTYSTVGGGYSNEAGYHSTVCGGYNNTASNEYSSVVCGGENNVAYRRYSFIGGGTDNHTNWEWSVIGGGLSNYTGGARCVVAGGQNNEASGSIGWAAVGGGSNNTASGNNSFIGGGYSNTADGDYSAVAGGANNNAQGNYSFAAGKRAKANHSGSFVWGDDTDSDFASTGDDQFLIRASGGVGIGIDNPTSALHVSGEAKCEVGGVEFFMVPQGAIIMWSGTLASIPSGWALCDGTNGTPDLRNRFIYGVSAGEDPGATGGSIEHNHQVNIPGAALGWAGAAVALPGVFSTTFAYHLPPYYKLAFIMKL